MIEDGIVPYPFADTAWTSDLSKCSIQTDCVWQYLQSKTSTVRQAHRGWALKEEEYVKNIRLNLDTTDPNMGVVRATCSPSMKSGVYVVSAWFEKTTGNVVGAHCQCVAGLSETCQHVAAALLAVAEKAADKTTCTDIPCRWIVPPEAKKPAPRLPLKEIAFQRHLVNQPARQKLKRDYDPSSKLVPCGDVAALKKKLCTSSPTLQLLRYLGTAEHKPPKRVVDTIKLKIADSDNLCDKHSALDDAQREHIRLQTVGQADNKQWHAARTGRLTASMFKRYCRCVKPEGLLKTVLYPNGKAMSEAIVYGRNHEKDAVDSYVQFQQLRGTNVQIQETGLHIHQQYPFLAASPDRIVLLDGEEGLLEVKCPFSKKGLAVEEACIDKRFCCFLEEDNEVVLKKDHPYYFQVQGQMAITGHAWCDFVIWIENDEAGEPDFIHVQRIYFKRDFWENEMLPALLHFAKWALVPELITQRVKRLGRLYLNGQYVSYKKLQQGFYVCKPGHGLAVTLQRLK
ncbi:uncharacterized protein LOC125945088 [Dermacentor silvarum]|uniref:uncharacterized protein LOC125945088 n=1 Tax=Dermacentor silvarum TaxID=543639 RepID=UPI0021018A4A|nr:uncharacterized protein LOC125945088 [Dermacentor silvarum]